MSKDKDLRAYIWDIISAAQSIQRILDGKTFTDFATNEVIRLAVERNIEIMGEAANRIPLEFQKRHSYIEWRGMIGQRNILIHNDDEIQYQRIWITCQREIPTLIDQLGILLNELDQEH